MRFARILLLLLSVPVWLVACGETAQTDQQEIAMFDRYFQALQAGDIDAAVALYPQDTQARWRHFLQDLEDKRGAVQSYTIESIEPNTVFSGKYYLATVHVVGSKKETTEMVTVLRKLSDKKIHVVVHSLQ
jgi:hypothetical protein